MSDDNTLRTVSRTTNASPGNLNNIDLSSSAWNLLEEEFQEVINELEELPQLEKFKIEYERLHKILQSSHKNETDLRKRCEELNQDIITTASKVQQSLSTLKEDQQLVAQLKREIEKTWKLVDQSRDKEQKDTEHLNKLVAKERLLAQEIKDGFPTHKTTAIEELEQAREKLSKDRDTSNSELIVLINEVTGLENKIKKFNNEKRGYMTHIQNMTDELTALRSEYNEQVNNIELAEQGLKRIKVKLENKNSEILAKESLIEKGNAKIGDLEQELKEQSLITQKAEKECESAEHKREKLDRDLKDQIKQNSKLYAENEELKESLRGKEVQIKSLKDQQAITQKTIGAFIKKRKELEDTRDKLEKDKQDIVEEFKKVTLDVNSMKRLLEMDKAKIEDLTHQRNILTKNINKAETDIETQKSQRKIAEGNRRNVLTKQRGYAAALEELRQDERRLKKETDKYVEELNQAKQRYEQAIEEGKIKRLETEELQQRIRDGQEKWKQQQALYEAVRSERNSYSKLLIDATEEIEAMNRSKKIMDTQIKKLRAEIEKRQDELLDQSAKQEKVKNTIEKIKKQINTLEKEIKEQESINRQHEEEIYKLNQIIKDADMERKRQQKEYESVMNDRDILGASLIKRNDELAHLYEKIKSQQSALKKGQSQFMEKSTEIETLQRHISQLHKKKVELIEETSSMDELATQVHRLKRELLQENMKIRSLQDELENPMNVHRWRKLEGSDPHSFKMIEKIQVLQKKLIEMTEEVMSMDMLIQQKEKLYLELKEVLIRQPGPEVAEQLNAFSSTLKQKTKEYNKLSEDLNATMLYTKEQENEKERLLRELGDIKRQYYALRKAENQPKWTGSVFDNDADFDDVLATNIKS